VELTRLYPRWIVGVAVSPQEAVQSACSIELLTTLKGSLVHEGYLSDLFGTDHPEQLRRTQLTWSVWGFTRAARYLVQGCTRGVAPTTTGVWPSAGWFEREVWELLGVHFGGHPDLRRLLTDYGFEGRPLWKNFPVTGYFEVRFSERAKRVVSKPVLFPQEFRVFDFQSPWQNLRVSP